LFLKAPQMKKTLTLLAFLFTVATAAHAQILPQATAGTAVLQYSARYAQSAGFYGGSLGDSQSAIVSGDVEYSNGFKRRPFSLTFGGGYSWNIAGTSYGDGLFENLLVSQGIVGRKWNIQLSDNIGYWKEAPFAGFSGVPGTGEPVGGPNSSPPSTQTILTLNTRSISNVVSGGFEHSLNYSTSLNVGGSWIVLRYPDGNGLDTSAQMANAGLSRRLNARSSVSGQYSFTYFSYPGNNLDIPITSFVSSGASFGYQRVWNRQISTSVSVGPEWTSSSNSAVVPSSTSVAVSASVSDQFRYGSASLSYTRAVSGGGGYLVGAEVSTVSGGFSREFERKLEIGTSGGYFRTSALDNGGEVSGRYGAATATLRLSRYITSFASYTATDQSSDYSLPSNALTGLWQVVSFGIGYSPREKHVNSQ
jgi:hypothetical protein